MKKDERGKNTKRRALMELLESYKSESDDDQNAKNVPPQVNNAKQVINSHVKRSVSCVQGYVSKRSRLNIVKQNDFTACKAPDVSGEELGRNQIYPNQEKSCSLPLTLKRSLVGHKAGVNCVRWGTSQREHLLASASMDGTVRIWDAFKSSSCVRVFNQHTAAVKDVKWAKGGNHLLSCGFDSTAQYVDINTSQVVNRFMHKDYTTVICTHPSNYSLFLCGGYSNGIVCWDIRSGTIVNNFNGAEGQVQDICFLFDSKHFIASTCVTKKSFLDKSIAILDFESGACVSHQIYTEGFSCPSIRLHPSGSHFIAQSTGNYIALFSTSSPYKLNKKKRYEGHRNGGYSIQCSFSHDGKIIATGTSDGKIVFYDYSSSRRLFSSIPGHQDACLGTEYHPILPSTLASCSWDKKIHLYQ